MTCATEESPDSVTAKVMAVGPLLPSAFVADKSMNPAVRVVSEEPWQRRLQVAEGDRTATLNVVPFSDDVSQLLIAGHAGPGERPTAGAMARRGWISTWAGETDPLSTSQSMIADCTIVQNWLRSMSRSLGFTCAK